MNLMLSIKFDQPVDLHKSHARPALLLKFDNVAIDQVEIEIFENN